LRFIRKGRNQGVTQAFHGYDRCQDDNDEGQAKAHDHSASYDGRADDRSADFTSADAASGNVSAPDASSRDCTSADLAAHDSRKRSHGAVQRRDLLVCGASSGRVLASRRCGGVLQIVAPSSESATTPN
jgi:hypothetical protein